jgi:arylsulfatase A-like enzyme
MPNIVILHADEHRFDCLGTTGNKDIQTPAINEMAADGIVYENCFATFPLCTPSRYSFLTGLYARQHLGATNETTLPAGVMTFPRALRDAGYDTACVGKMHFGPTYLDVGFQRMWLAEQAGPGRFDDDYHRHLVAEGLVDATDMQDQVYECRFKAPPSYFDDLGTEPSDLPEADYSTSWIRDRALDEIAGWDNDRPHLLMVGFIKPHHPFDVPAPWCDQYDPEALELLPGWTEDCLPRDRFIEKGHFDNSAFDEARYRRVLARYYGSISQIDHATGQIVDLLKDKGLYDDAMLMYTSDHGDFMGFHHMILKGCYMYDPVIKVPLVVKYPGQDRAGTREPKLVSTIDATATILDAGNFAALYPISGVAQPLDDAEREAVFAEDGHGNIMARTADKKVLLCREGESQFYDLARDPLELDNLMADPSVKDDRDHLVDLAYRWAAFDARPLAHVHHGAPQISMSTMPDDAAESHDRVKKWLMERAGEWLTKKRE